LTISSRVTDSISLRQLDKAEIKSCQWFAGVRPHMLRRTLLMWLAFSIGMAWIVAIAPELDPWFSALTYIVLIVFTFALFGQSRIDEGWPSLIAFDDALGVIQDPYSRTFILVHASLVKEVNPIILKPTKRAVELALDAAALSENDIHILLRAVWPRDHSLIAATPMTSRKKVISAVTRWLAR